MTCLCPDYFPNHKISANKEYDLYIDMIIGCSYLMNDLIAVKKFILILENQVLANAKMYHI